MCKIDASNKRYSVFVVCLINEHVQTAWKNLETFLKIKDPQVLYLRVFSAGGIDFLFKNISQSQLHLPPAWQIKIVEVRAFLRQIKGVRRDIVVY